MVSIMRDALGVGLAATQLGIMHRLLVFQAGLDATPTAIVNPELEWLSDELAIAEEGCLSLPGVDGRRRAAAARAGPRPRRARRAAAGRGLGARGPRPAARDRPPGRGADPRPHGARAAKGRAPRAPGGRELQPSSDRRGLEHRGGPGFRGSLKVVYLGTSEFAVAVLRRLADSPHRPVLVVTPPDRPRGRGRKLAPPPVAAAAGELGIELHQTAGRQAARGRWSGSGPAAPKSGSSARSAS